jgi:hypothetical protein
MANRFCRGLAFGGDFLAIFVDMLKSSIGWAGGFFVAGNTTAAAPSSNPTDKQQSKRRTLGYTRFHSAGDTTLVL